MTRRENLLGLSAAVVVGFLLAASSFGGFPAALGLVHDSQSTSVGFAASDNLTVTVENGTVSPAVVAVNDPENVTVSLALQFPESVNTSRVSVSVVSNKTARSTIPERVRCDDRCSVVVSGRDLVRLANGPGEYELIVRGWWEYDREFVATVPITIDNSASNRATGADRSTNATATPPRNGTATATPTSPTNESTPTPPANESTSTPPANESTSTPAVDTSTPNESTSTPTPTATSTPTATPTESTPTATPTATSTPTATPDESTPTGNTTSQSNSTSERIAWPGGVQVSSWGR